MAGDLTTAAAPAASPASAPSSSPSASPPPSPAASPSASTPPAQTPSSSTPPAATAPAEWQRPSYFPETVKSEADAEKFVKDHVTFKALEDSRRLTLPQKPEDYEFALPADFQIPQGVEFKLNPDDPMVAQAREFAKAAGMDKDQFKKMVGMYAASEIGRLQQMQQTMTAEIGKLGATGSARVTAVQQFIEAQVGPDVAKEMSKGLLSAPMIEGWEKIMSTFRSQGVGSFSQQHRDEQPVGKLTNEQYNALSYSEKVEYARKHSQPALNGAGR